jgi:hypothetical protein
VTTGLFRFWRRLHLGRPALADIHFVESPTDVPERLFSSDFVVVGTRERARWAIFDCPCGRGHRLMLSLQRSHRPHWRLELGPRGPSLWPSVDSVSRYRCHFWLREGHVHWVHGWGWPTRVTRRTERENTFPAA